MFSFYIFPGPSEGNLHDIPPSPFTAKPKPVSSPVSLATGSSVLFALMSLRLQPEVISVPCVTLLGSPCTMLTKAGPMTKPLLKGPQHWTSLKGGQCGHGMGDRGSFRAALFT